MSRILLIDSLAILYRGYYAMLRNPLRSSDGTNTSGLYHLLGEMLDKNESRSPDLTIAVFDHPSPSFRSEIYPEYKANRPPMPVELRKQTDIARKLIPEMGFPVLEIQGLEADDIIAVLADSCSRKGDSVEILSPDKDLLQLVNERVSVIRPGRSGSPATIIGEENVEDIMGVPPDRIADFLALTGDSSDNIPGARGIGPKTACKLIGEFGSISFLYEHLDNVKPDSVRRKLVESRDMVYLSRKLVLLPSPGQLEITIDDIRIPPGTTISAINLLGELGMQRILDKLHIEHEKDAHLSSTSAVMEPWCSTRIIESAEDLKAWDPPGDYGTVMAFDTETTSVRPFQADPVGVSFSADGIHSVYIPLSGRDPDDLKEITGILSGKLRDCRLVAQNAKYDMHIMDSLGLNVLSIHGDPMIASYLVEPERQIRSLSHLAKTLLGIEMKNYSDVLGAADTLADVDTKKVADYCGCDSAAALLLHRVFTDKLKDDEGLQKLYEELELPLVRVLADMEKRGVRIDIDSLDEMDVELTIRIGELHEKAAEEAGFPINLNSPSQVSDVLFRKLGLAPVRKTRKGALSSSMDVLEKLSGQHEFVDTVIEHRELSKLLGTYIRKLPGYICQRDGIVHTNFNQTVTATGRLSSSNPNLQNIPIRTSRGREVRKCFKPGIEGNVFVSADYSQIELRVLAHFAGPGNLRESFERNLDIHSSTAVALFGDSSPLHRRKAKEVNFSIMYGISPWGLSNRLGISREEAAGIIDRYLATYPELDFFFRKCITDAEITGETRTILQRRRNFEGFASAKGAERRSMERIVINTTIQGSAADIIKLAMLRVDSKLREMEGAGLVLQVHDELVASCPEKSVDRVGRILKTEMESALELEVPLTVVTGYGSNWLQAQH